MMNSLSRCIRRSRAVFAAAVCVVLATLTAAPAQAVIGANDNAPAATLLLPYFEIDLNNGNGPQTAIRLTNASATAILANVTLWTDWGIASKSFQIYLVGFDTSEIDLRLVFKGHLPRTASAGQDPFPDAREISPQGPFSQDINFASCTGILPYPLMLPAEVTALRNAHTGVGSATFGGSCGGKNYGDGLARGYVTIDTVNACTGLNPAAGAPYFDGFITFQNVMVASATTINRAQNFASSDPLVHVEASFTDPIANTSGQPTFYARFNNTTATDRREPLGTVWNARYFNGGVFTGGTSLVAWQDPGQVVAPALCGNTPAPFPLVLGGVAAFDEQEEVAVSPGDGPALGSLPEIIGGGVTSFPVVTQRVSTMTLSPFSFGHLFLNFNQYPPAGGPPARRQSVVTVQHDSTGRFAASTGAVRLFGAHESSQPGLIGN